MRFVLLVLLLPLFWGQADAADYIIGDGDVLNISVWGVPALSGPVIVRPDGKITLPVGGDVMASGMTSRALNEELTEILSGYVKKPIVTVRVDQVTNNKVYVSGDGMTPQIVQLTGRTNLFKFLCGLPDIDNGDLRRAYIMRDGKRIIGDFHALLKQGDFTQDLELQADDIIFIPSRELSKIYVLGAVNEPKFLVFRDGIRVMDAVIEAGGFTEFAKANSLTVHRSTGEKLKVRGEDLLRGKDLDQNIFLQPGDYVTVEEGIF